MECDATNRAQTRVHPHAPWAGSRETIGRVSTGISGGAEQGEKMAKALYGHVTTAPDRRLVDEVTKLRARVSSLEFENARLRAENDRLAAAVAGSDEDEFFRLAEPVLA
jgi:hypothetical protein